MLKSETTDGGPDYINKILTALQNEECEEPTHVEFFWWHRHFLLLRIKYPWMQDHYRLIARGFEVFRGNETEVQSIKVPLFSGVWNLSITPLPDKSLRIVDGEHTTIQKPKMSVVDSNIDLDIREIRWLASGNLRYQPNIREVTEELLWCCNGADQTGDGVTPSRKVTLEELMSKEKHVNLVLPHLLTGLGLGTIALKRQVKSVQELRSDNRLILSFGS